MGVVTIPLGEREGQLLRAHEVENGLRCGCVCPGCGGPLVAANQGEKRLPYFRHAEIEGCANGRTEGIRRAAVDLIARKKALLLPMFSDSVGVATHSGRLISQDVRIPPLEIHADQVDRFVDLGDLRAHALVVTNRRRLVVRIKVSPRQEHERLERLQAMDFSSMEVDLHELTDAQINDVKAFERAVLGDADNRRWIRSIRGEQLCDKALAEIAVLVDKANCEWAAAEEKRIAAEKLQALLHAEQEAQRFDALRAHRITQEEMAAKQLMLAPKTSESRDTRKQREALIVETLLKAVHQWGGRGAECSACRLINPPEAQFCFYCRSEASRLQDVTYAPDFEKNLENRMRCSAAPDQSLRLAPQLMLRSVDL